MAPGNLAAGWPGGGSVKDSGVMGNQESPECNVTLPAAFCPPVGFQLCAEIGTSSSELALIDVSGADSVRINVVDDESDFLLKLGQIRIQAAAA